MLITRLMFALIPAEETWDLQVHLDGHLFIDVTLAAGPSVLREPTTVDYKFMYSLCGEARVPPCSVLLPHISISGCIIHTILASTGREGNNAPNAYAYKKQRISSEILIETVFQTRRCFTRINLTFIWVISWVSAADGRERLCNVNKKSAMQSNSDSHLLRQTQSWSCVYDNLLLYTSQFTLSHRQTDSLYRYLDRQRSIVRQTTNYRHTDR